jgi:hypothetical protein
MKANQLRIGNYIMDGHDVEEVNYRMIEMLVKNQAEFDPIPLTEEWLLKFGFEDCRHNLMALRVNTFEFFFDKIDKCGVNLYEKWEGIFLCGGIKHVHQLQNLYFALTGEELTIDKQ